MSAGRRETAADWLMVVAGLGLLAALFLPWSHQLTPAVIARYGGGPALQGVPAHPDAWQVYSVADVLLAVVAVGLLAAALRGGRPARLVLLAGVAGALAFTVHALAVPPTNGVLLIDPGTTRYLAVHARSGLGEVVALAAMAVGGAGLLLSFTSD